MSSENEPEPEPASPISPSSLKQKLKSTLRLPWLRHHSQHEHHQRGAASASTTPRQTPSPSPTASNHNKAMLSRTSSASTRLKSPDFKDKCRNLINRIGHGPVHRHSHSHGHGHHGHVHGRRHSADFRYDPSSYALNFDEGSDGSQLDEFPSRNFTARLPPSPVATTPPCTSQQKNVVL